MIVYQSKWKLFAWVAGGVPLAGAGILALMLCGFLYGHDRPVTTWSMESRSPDGLLVADARTVAYPVLPGADIETTVELSWVTGQKRSMTVLGVGDGPYMKGDPTILTMKWLSAKELGIFYYGSIEPNFQAVRCDGVTITLQQRSSLPSR